jgi:antitoxin component of MazEF toxin-antitoxin module
MGRRKLIENHIRKLTRVGGTSLAVTIPLGIVNKFKLREKQKVTVRARGKKIIIEDWKDE